MTEVAFANGGGQAPEKLFDDFGKFHFTKNWLDPDDPEYVRQLLRPAEIKEDLSAMSQRRRVSLVLKSEAFRKELEEILETYSRSNDNMGLNSSLLSLQHIPEMLSTVPGKRPITGGGFTRGISGYLFASIIQDSMYFARSSSMRPLTILLML